MSDEVCQVNILDETIGVFLKYVEHPQLIIGKSYIKIQRTTNQHVINYESLRSKK